MIVENRVRQTDANSLMKCHRNLTCQNEHFIQCSRYANLTCMFTKISLRFDALMLYDYNLSKIF